MTDAPSLEKIGTEIDDPFSDPKTDKFVSISSNQLKALDAKYKLNLPDDKKEKDAIFFGSSSQSHVYLISQNLRITKEEAEKVLIKDAGLLKKVGSDIHLFGFGVDLTIQNMTDSARLSENERNELHKKTAEELQLSHPDYKFHTI